MYRQTRQGLGQTVIPQPTRRCDNRHIPTRGAVQTLTPRRVACTQHNAFGVTDPFSVISRAVARALEMLDNTIGELVNARNAVCAGGTPAWPLLGDITSYWLRNRLGVCIDDIRAWTAGTFVNRSVAEVIRRLMRVRNLIGSNLIRYSCGSPHCQPDFWAFVGVRDAAGNCLPGTPQMLVRLCRRFLVPEPGVDPKVHAEFQAQVIIHEASHLTHCTRDPTGSTIGVAECLRQFVAATNGSPLYRGFETRCPVTDRCAGTAAATRPVVAELGFALGTNSLPVEIQKLLDEVRKRPQDYKPLLLTIIFDPVPGYSNRTALSDALKRLNLLTADAAAVLLSSRLKQIVWELEPIRADLQKRDARFQQLIDAELKLQSEMMETAGGIRPQKRFEPFLFKASLIRRGADLPLYWLGLDFAKEMLPLKLTQRIMSSAVSVGHLTYLGQFLQRLAEVWQSRNTAFKQRVEQERKSRK